MGRFSSRDEYRDKAIPDAFLVFMLNKYVLLLSDFTSI